ncbi:MAG: zinc ribbon domain-containing protein [Bacteroidetes bacterium]|nr:zinc ribbon domain-containing protein [Bacteroidota bacterium]
MPTYDYACKKCGHRFEVFQSMKDPVLTTCPRCEQESLQRLIGAGAGLVFKGSGFYLTDYKKSAVTPPSNGGGDSSRTSAANGEKADRSGTQAPKAPAAEKPAVP